MTESPEAAITVAALSEIGPVYRENQDAFLIADLRQGAGEVVISHGDRTEYRSQTPFVMSECSLLLAVADGDCQTGGSPQACRVVAETLLDQAGTGGGLEAVLQALEAGVQRANANLWEISQGPENPMQAVTGFTAVLISGPVVQLAHVGESAAYLVRAGKLHLLTQEQTLAGLLVAADVLAPEDTPFLPAGGAILQVLGTRPEVQVALGSVALCRGDRLILCTHAPWKRAAHSSFEGLAEIEQAVLGDVSAAVAADKLIEWNERTKAGGAIDNFRWSENMTILLADFDGSDLPEPADEGFIIKPITAAGFGMPELESEVEHNSLRESLRAEVAKNRDLASKASSSVYQSVSPESKPSWWQRLFERLKQ